MWKGTLPFKSNIAFFWEKDIITSRRVQQEKEANSRTLINLI